VARDFARIRLRGTALVMMSALLLGGCGESRVVEPPGDPTGLVGWVTVSPDVFQPGDEVRVEVGIRNPTTRPLTVGFTSGSCALGFVVTSGAAIVAARPDVCTADAPIVELAPGQTISAEYTWDGTGLALPLLPGEYQVIPMSFQTPAVAPVTIRIITP
jgi:hypothetical protein